jgi:hypothetical protein
MGLTLCLVHPKLPVMGESAADRRIQSAAKPATAETVSIQLLESGPADGHAYRMEYRVAVPIETFWNFKTDFQGHFLSSSKQIRQNRFVRRQGNVVWTEVSYTSLPGSAFLWETRVDASQHRLEFELVNAEAIGHRFHRGTIELHRDAGGTRVVQTAFFDFRGASLWVYYPWQGGMKSFLRSMAIWERQTAVNLQNQYRKAVREIAVR